MKPMHRFIALCGSIGLASDLKRFPANEIRKGAFTMEVKELKKKQDSLDWPSSREVLSRMDWDMCEFKTFPATPYVNKNCSPGTIWD